MMPDPLAGKFSAGGMVFKWIDGIFGMALTPLNKSDLTAARGAGRPHPLLPPHEQLPRVQRLHSGAVQQDRLQGQRRRIPGTKK
jgi:Major royal jelly protein